MGLLENNYNLSQEVWRRAYAPRLFGGYRAAIPLSSRVAKVLKPLESGGAYEAE